ncbi:hypothetical protein GCM10027040_12040 [Halomonas shantousis]
MRRKQFGGGWHIDGGDATPGCLNERWFDRSYLDSFHTFVGIAGACHCKARNVAVQLGEVLSAQHDRECIDVFLQVARALLLVVFYPRAVFEKRLQDAWSCFEWGLVVELVASVVAKSVILLTKK